MGRRGDKRSHSRRRSRSPQRRRTSDSGRRRSRSTSRSSERFPSRRRRSYSRSSSRGRSRRHRARRSASPSPSRSSRNRRRSRSRSNSHSRSRRGRSRTRSRNRSRSGSYSRSRRSPSPRRESRHRSPSVHRDGRTENRRKIRREDTREDRWGDRHEDKREDRQGDHRGDTPDSRHAPLREHHAGPTIVDQHKPHKETSPIFQDKAKTPNEPTRLTDHPPPNCVVEESKPHPPEETKRSAHNDRPGDRQPVSTPNSVDSTPASTPLSYQRAIVSVPEDPVAKKRRAVREEAYHAYMKSSLVRAQAVAKFHAADTNVRMAETWLEFVDKTLEDVGRRIELQDWKFKKLEQGGMDLHELLEAPVLHDREPE